MSKRKLEKNEKIIEKITIALHSQYEANEWKRKYFKLLKGKDACVLCGQEMCKECIQECSTCETTYCSNCIKYCKGKCYKKICKNCGPYCEKDRPPPVIEKVE